MIALLFALFFSQAQAFEAFPEFHSLDRTEWDGFDQTKRIDSEYASDWLTFQKPLAWEAEFATHKKALDISPGSLSSRQFYIHDRLKIEHALTPRLEFRFAHFAQRDFEVDESRQIMELLYRTPLGNALSVFGSTSLYKSENDLGLAIESAHQHNRHSRLYVMWPDFNRNQRNIDNDRWVDGFAPFTLGFKHLRLDNFLELNLRHEFPAHLNFPTDQYEYRYQASSISLQWRAPRELKSWQGRILADRKFEEHAPYGSSAIAAEIWRRDRLLTQLEYELPISEKNLTLGLSYQHRSYDRNGEMIAFRDILPYLWLQIHNWQWGLESTFHSEDQNPIFQTLPRRAYKVEYRGNVRYNWDFENSKLSLIFSADLDRFGTGESWEGGNAQFSLFF